MVGEPSVAIETHFSNFKLPSVAFYVKMFFLKFTLNDISQSISGIKMNSLT